MKENNVCLNVVKLYKLLTEYCEPSTTYSKYCSLSTTHSEYCSLNTFHSAVSNIHWSSKITHRVLLIINIVHCTNTLIVLWVIFTELLKYSLSTFHSKFCSQRTSHCDASNIHRALLIVLNEYWSPSTTHVLRISHWAVGKIHWTTHRIHWVVFTENFP